MINNLKKVISSAAVVAMVASSVSAMAVTFPDVDESASYANAVSTLTALGVVDGDDQGLFNPDKNVTRAEFAKMVVEALGEGAAASATTTSRFTDAANTTVHWAAGYIAQGVADGFINGYDDTTFGPDDSVTYEQAVKMLVAAIGYTTYAEKAGGYPSGYLSYGSSLKIINGVTVDSNSTALTRSQCAVLINNATQAPLVVYGDVTYGGILGNVPLDTLVIKNGQGADWQTLLTEKHDAYVVKGRVLETSRTNDGLDDNEVTFQVEAADNFDDKYYAKNGLDPETFDMYVGDTKAADMLFTYAEAVVQKDPDSDEWTILSIQPYGTSKTVEFAADDVADDDSQYPYDKIITNGRIPVYKSATSSSTTKYDLDDDVKLYVNGVELPANDDNIVSYVINNSTGTVTLVDSTEEASTSTDGKYDYILVDYYLDAVVDMVQESSTDVKVYFKSYDQAIGASRLSWDPEDEDTTVTFTDAEGNAVNYADLAEYDVLSIAYNVDSKFADSSFYEVKVAKNQVTGTVTSKDIEENTLRIDGNDYEGAGLVDVSSYDLSTEYTLYLDTFGYIAYIEEGSSAKNYGVVVGMYMGNGDDQPTVRLVAADGSIIEKEVKDSTEANRFYTVLKTAGEFDPMASDAKLMSYSGDGNPNVTKTTVRDLGDVEYNVCTYTLSSDKLRYKEYVAPRGGEGLEYKASNSKLGSYTITDSVTKVLDMDGYINGSDTTVGTLSVSSFEDEATYTAYAYDRNNNGDYRLILVLEGTSSLRPETAVAVVKSNPQTTDVDGTECYSMEVVRNGVQETPETLLYEATGVNLSEGDVITYTVGSNGYVEADNLYVLMYANSDYDSLYNDMLSTDNFANVLETKADDGTVIFDPADNFVKYGSTSKEVQQYFGAVYRKSGSTLELFVGQENGTSNINDATLEEVSLTSDTKFYVYDYSRNTKYRVSAATSIPDYSNSVYNPAYTDGDKTTVSWDKMVEENCTPNFAYAKVVEGDATEVVIFAAE